MSFGAQWLPTSVRVAVVREPRGLRNLHDRAQQRLVSATVGLSMMGAKLESDPKSARELLTTAQADLARGLEELSELARGMHRSFARSVVSALRRMRSRHVPRSRRRHGGA